jgi:putative transposase
MLKKTFKFRLYPNRKQRDRLTATLDICRELYNAALQERINAWKNNIHINLYDQTYQLPDIKTVRPDITNVYSQVLTDVLFRMDKAFKAFFRRVKRGQTPGFPRFKGHNRYDSFTYPQNGFELNGRLQLSKIGNIKIKQHRPIVGKIKTLTIRRQAGCWYACFSVEYAPAHLPYNNNIIGIDVGLECFGTLSDGRRIDNPHFYRNAQKQLRRAQRKVARRVNKSKRRSKAIILLQKVHAHIANQRKDFHHKLAYKLVQNFGTIAVENLNVRNLSKGFFANAIYDVGWASFINILAYKAENAGRQLIKVDSKYTSQECPNCRTIKKKQLSERIHRCDCGLTLHRDHAAALVILGRGLRLQALTAGQLASVV